MSSKSTINVAVCGKFHLFNYMAQLHGIVDNFYFSARLGKPKEFGLDGQYIHNSWLKEYAIQGHYKLLGDFAYEKMSTFYHLLWRLGIYPKWKKCELFHFVSHGAALELVNKAKYEKAITMAEVVNTHPSYRQNIIKEEAEKWGIPFTQLDLLKREKRSIQEVEIADIILAPSKVVANSYLANGATGKTYILPYVADIARFSQFEKVNADPKAPLRLLCVGRIGLRKGQLYLLQAISELKCKVELTLVGSIDSSLADLVKRSGVSFNHIERVANEDMPNLFQRHDVFVLPSLEEGVALSIGEAMATGLAVIATRESGGEELITHSENGLIVDSKNSTEIKTLLEMLDGDRELVSRLGEKAKADAIEKLNWTHYAEDLKSIYKLGLQHG